MSPSKVKLRLLSKGLMNDFDYDSISDAEVKNTYEAEFSEDTFGTIKAVVSKKDVPSKASKCGKVVCLDYNRFVMTLANDNQRGSSANAVRGAFILVSKLTRASVPRRDNGMTRMNIDSFYSKTSVVCYDLQGKLLPITKDKPKVMNKKSISGPVCSLKELFLIV
ncbi:uncharacterized protein EV154DRAFT_477863 [Mucor mucedo]|uniref:uncharacterized protein n=1 Tax=Mucor mucedo TaxID=29922 RepID=UPI002220446D|nr:uncharacterized protein EV154DRAFT_477863 [Mucor mucedo]KAI7895093.1 hypothetical protein EV154DRAFT_477863 [Mucor mucedo]